MTISPAYQNSTSSEASVLLGLPFKATLAIVTAVNGNGSLSVTLQDGPGEELVVWPLPYLVVQVGAQVWVGWFSGVPVVVGGLTGVTIHAAEADHAAESDHAVTAEDAGLLAGQGAAYYLNRTSHTGTQPASTISDFDETAYDVIGAALVESATIAFTANDGANQISAAVKPDSITGSLIDSSTITNTHLADMASATVKGRVAGAGAGPPADLTAAQLVALLSTADGAGSGLDADTLQGLSASTFVRVDGSLPLSGDWDVGEDRRIRAEALRARDDEGLRLEDAAGNLGMLVAEGGGVTLLPSAAAATVTVANSNLVLDPALPGLRGNGGLILRIDADNNQSDRVLLVQKDAGTELLRLQENGCLGIGQSLPTQLLEVAAALTGAAGAHVGAPVIRLTQKANTSYNIGDVHSGIEFYTEDVGGSLPGITGYIRAITTRANGVTNADAGLVFGTSNGSGGTAVDRLAIDTNGFVGIGTLVPIGKLTVDAETNCYIFVGAHGTGVEPGLALYATRGTAAAPTATQAGDTLGSLYFQGWDTARSTGARIYAVAAAEWGTAGSATDSPADLRFATVPDGSSTLTDRLVITSAGLVGIATTAPTLSDGLGLDVNGKLLRLRTNKTPATSSAPGNPGELCADDIYLYRYCTNQWKRIPWSTF